VLSPREILQSATVVGAELLGRAGELGVVAPGALADLLVLDGNPLQDLKLFQDQGAHLAVIMQGGRLHKNALTAA
jgi:imidazolonepropionase-like amidohydrolase